MANVWLWITVVHIIHVACADVLDPTEVLRRLDALEKTALHHDAAIQSIQSEEELQALEITSLDKKLGQTSSMTSNQEHSNKTETDVTEIEIVRRQSSLSDLTGETSGVYQRVAFTASFIGNFTQTLSNTGPAQFPHVILNVRRGYSSTSGIFVAPVPGVYIFSVTALCQEGNQCSLELVQNDGGVTVMRAGSLLNRRDQGQMTALLRLEEEDRVFVRGYQSQGQQLWGDGHTVFTGVMLWALA